MYNFQTYFQIHIEIYVLISVKYHDFVAHFVSDLWHIFTLFASLSLWWHCYFSETAMIAEESEPVILSSETRPPCRNYL